MDEDWQMGKYLFLGLIALALIFLGLSRALARDDGRYAQADPQIRAWFNSLRQPDNPIVSCCGEADAVEADEWRANADGSVTATVTDGRGYVPNGMVVQVPKGKVNHEPNPTGHAILFLTRDGHVWCFVLGTGI